MRLRSGVASVSRPSSAQSHANLRQKRQDKNGIYQKGPHRSGPQLSNTTIGQPPPGYTFLAVGYPDLSAKCKELSREKRVDIKVVSASNKFQKESSKVSSHLHRIGYHIRTDVFDEACTWLGYRFVNGKLVKDVAANPASGFERTFARFGADISQFGTRSATQEESQKVKNAIRELFPKIPEESLNEIFETAWQKGATTVGNETDLPLARRVQLATVAHIRHTYTDYDRILQASSWADARKAVEPYCLAKLVEWRGEDETNDNAIDDLLQEAIVFSDDESPVELSEPDRYADNEDSSDGNLEVTHRAANPADLERTPSAFEGSPRSGLSRVSPQWVKQPQPLGEKHRGLLQARWRHARLYGIQPYPSLPLATNTSAQNISSPLDSMAQITVPVDHRGRAPRKFIQDGVEYVRATPAELAQHNIMVPMQSHQDHVQYNHTQYASPIQVPLAPPHFPASGQYQHRITEAPVAYEVIARPVQDLPPQRFFDNDGNEVFLDPASHLLTPAFAEQPPRTREPQSAFPASQDRQQHSPVYNSLPRSTLTSPPRFLPLPAPNKGYAETILGHDDSEEEDVYEPPSADGTRAAQKAPKHPALYNVAMPPGARVRTITPEATNRRRHPDTQQRYKVPQSNRETFASASLSDDDDSDAYNPAQPTITNHHPSQRFSTARDSTSTSKYYAQAADHRGLPSSFLQGPSADHGSRHGAPSVQSIQYSTFGASVYGQRHVSATPVPQHQPVSERSQYVYNNNHFPPNHVYGAMGPPSALVYPSQHYDPYGVTPNFHPSHSK